MHQKWQASPGDMRQGHSQMLLCNHGETVDTGVHQKAFEPSHPGICEGFNMILIIVNHPAPRRPIDAALALCGRALSLQRSHRRGRRKTIQRHVDEQCVSTCRRGSCGCFETLPLGSARLVDVHVRIDEPWKNGGCAEVMNFVTIGGNLIRRDNTLDALSFDQYGGGTNFVGSDHSASAESLQIQNVGSSKDSPAKAEGIPVAALFQCAVNGAETTSKDYS